jgi:hypothetical protein
VIKAAAAAMMVVKNSSQRVPRLKGAVRLADKFASWIGSVAEPVYTSRDLLFNRFETFHQVS